MSPEKNDFTLEKLKISDKLDTIILNQEKFHKQIWGDPEKGITGLDARVIILEQDKASRINIKKEAAKMVIGSMTIAIGGAIVWIGVAIKTAFMGNK